MKGITKGFTLTVKSWENDGDNKQTRSKTVATKEEAKVWYDMMKLCTSKNNQKPGVIRLGNSFDGFNNKQAEVAKDFIKKHHAILLPDDNIEENEEDLADWFCDLASELLGNSEDYSCRVMESCVVTYSPVDVIVEIVKF